jgi:hypothetical protein
MFDGDDEWIYESVYIFFSLQPSILLVYILQKENINPGLVVGLERGPLSLARIIEELLEWKSSGSGQENRINGRGGYFLVWEKIIINTKEA